MLLSGFTFIRNARKFDYPILECIQSALPIVDEFIINCGRSEDETEKLLQSVQNPKIKIVYSVWDETKVRDGLILSEQTNFALQHCKGQWGLYLQADEAIHEEDHQCIRQAVENARTEIEAFRFPYFHFYGGYTVIQRKKNWYPMEIRLIRLNRGIYSYGDAQTFRGPNDRSLVTQDLSTPIYHYGHARAPSAMKNKIHYFHRFWHGDEHGIRVEKAYDLDLKDLVWFWKDHPRVYQDRVKLGREWSLVPSAVLKKEKTKSVFFLYNQQDQWQAKLFERIKKEITGKDPAITILHATSFLSWLRIYCSRHFNKSTMVLVNLNAQGTLLFPDPLFRMGWRVAYVPKGKLGWLKKKCYSAIAWCRHEAEHVGFAIPPEEHARQVIKWIGYDGEKA